MTGGTLRRADFTRRLAVESAEGYRVGLTLAETALGLGSSERCPVRAAVTAFRVRDEP